QQRSDLEVFAIAGVWKQEAGHARTLHWRLRERGEQLGFRRTAVFVDWVPATEGGIQPGRRRRLVRRPADDPTLLSSWPDFLCDQSMEPRQRGKYGSGAGAGCGREQ